MRIQNKIRQPPNGEINRTCWTSRSSLHAAIYGMHRLNWMARQMRSVQMSKSIAFTHLRMQISTWATLIHLSSVSSQPRVCCYYKRQLKMLEKTWLSWLIFPELNSSSSTRIAMAFKLAFLLAVVAFASVVSPNLFAHTITFDVN
jgi:hypothetical protein